MKKMLGYTLTELVIVFFMLPLVIGAIWGWVWNIIKIVHAVSDPITAMFVLRCVGIFFAPLGAIIGFF